MVVIFSTEDGVVVMPIIVAMQVRLNDPLQHCF